MEPSRTPAICVSNLKGSVVDKWPSTSTTLLPSWSVVELNAAPSCYLLMNLFFLGPRASRSLAFLRAGCPRSQGLLLLIGGS